MIRSPLLWSGSKFDLLPEILPMIQGRLWEPFCGSAVVSLNYAGESVISDRNAELMNFWSRAKDGSLIHTPDPRCLFEDFYYSIRKDFNTPSRIWDGPGVQIVQAQRFLYLNRTCWRGLYRENNKGEFNVPWGARKRVEWPSMPDMRRVAVLPAQEYYYPGPTWEGFPVGVRADTIYCDPPYVGTHSYGVKFDHERFATWCQTRTERVLVSNSPTAVDLFPGWSVIELTAKGGIGHRRKEVLLWNGK
jgi:DNA adenine methylase